MRYKAPISLAAPSTSWTRYSGLRAQHPILARGRVRYAWEPVAALAAETAFAEEDALAAITATYAKLPAVADQETAMEEGAPCLHEAVPRNIAYRYHRAHGDTGRAFPEAAVVVRRRLTNNRVTAADRPSGSRHQHSPPAPPRAARSAASRSAR
jgi:CO/xanthine dehydrogenase Mo-binding subunit